MQTKSGPPSFPVPAAYPQGKCWCGCGADVPERSYFKPNHDRKAESAVIKRHYGSIARFLASHGYGPVKPAKPACTDEE